MFSNKKPPLPYVVYFHQSGMGIKGTGAESPTIDDIKAVHADVAANAPAIDEPTDDTDDSSNTPDDSDTDPNNNSPALAIDFEIKDKDGKAAKFSSLFKKQYLVLDLSAQNCGYCHTMAQEDNSDQDFQRMIQNGKCDFAVAVGERDLAAWGSRYKGTFVGARTFASGNSAANVASKFKFSLRGTPTVLIIDRQGTVLADQTGAKPDAVASTCR